MTNFIFFSNYSPNAIIFLKNEQILLWNSQNYYVSFRVWECMWMCVLFFTIKCTWSIIISHTRKYRMYADDAPQWHKFEKLRKYSNKNIWYGKKEIYFFGTYTLALSHVNMNLQISWKKKLIVLNIAGMEK